MVVSRSFVLLLFVVSIFPLFMSLCIASSTGNLSSEALSLRPFTVVEFLFIVRICYSHANPSVHPPGLKNTMEY